MDRRIKNPSDSNVCRMNDCQLYTPLKGSNVYRNDSIDVDTTPSGSHVPMSMFFYKHQIPSGLFLESMEAEIEKGLKELKEWM